MSPTVKALPGNPYDGHTLAAVLPDIESTIGAGLERIVTDAGYKGHNAPKHQRFKVYVAGQKRGLTAAIKRAFRRRSAVEPTIGHLKNEHRMGRNHLAGRAGDAANAVLAAVGYNFGLLLRWLALLLRIVLAVLHVVQAHAVDGDEPALRRKFPLGADPLVAHHGRCGTSRRGVFRRADVRGDPDRSAHGRAEPGRARTECDAVDTL